MSDSNDNEKTEEPTQKRLQDAVKKGQVAFSRETTSFLIFLVLALNIIWFSPQYMKLTTQKLAAFIQTPHDMRLDQASFTELFGVTLGEIGLVFSIPIIATIIAAFASSFLQNGIVISTESITPKLEKISVFKGLKRLFSTRSVVEFIKGLIKISLIATASYLVVKPEIARFANMVTYPVNDIIAVISTLSIKIVIIATLIMFVIAMADTLYQRFEYVKSLKMTKQEIKEEFKQSEGDPQIKAKLRQIRMERAQKRMMTAVPNADVVIRNPTHFAIALEYDREKMAAPMVTALGQDNIALKIIEVAEEHDVPVVTNKPLARALYDACEIDASIPLEHYQAVAEVIGYIYKLKNQ